MSKGSFMVDEPTPLMPRPLTDYIHMRIETISGKVVEADVKPSSDFDGYTLDLATGVLYKNE